MEYTVDLQGEAQRDVRLEVRLASDMLETLDKGARRALRLHTEGRSELLGTYPKVLAPAANFTLVAVRESPARLTLRSPRIDDVLDGSDLLRDVPPASSAVGLFADALRDALEGRTDSDNVDEGLVAGFGDLASIFNRGVRSVRIQNGRADALPVIVRDDQLEDLRNFKIRRPAPRTLRIVGKLDAIRHSDNAFTLVTATGNTVRGALAPDADESLDAFYGRQVVASGVVHFKASGRLLRFDAKAIGPAAQEDLILWTEDPKPLFGPGSGFDVRKPQGPRSGLNAVFGRWPIGGTDEQALAAIDSVSADR